MTGFDALIVGAGPTGLACGIELQQRGVQAVIVDKGCVVNSLYHYPTHMTFFTTPELLEIGNIPMTSMYEKPTRTEALKYYRRVAEHYKLDIRQYERVDRVTARTAPSRRSPPTGSAARTATTPARSSWPPAIMMCPTCSMCRARNSTRSSLLQGAASVLQPRRGRGGRQELGRHCRTRVFLDRRAGYPDPPRRGHLRQGQVLDQAQYRKPHQERRDQGVLSIARAGDLPGLDPHRDARG